MIKLSHSKLSCILDNPMDYYIKYIQKISIKTKSSALSIGSAVHWGIEHNTDDLTEYYNENGTFKQKDNYTKEQLLCESMVHGYLKQKDKLFNELLTDDGKMLSLLDESHEIYLSGKLPSQIADEKENEFIGIIDLLLLTEKGFVLVDYKTSTMPPDWDKYLDQIYRYIMLLNYNFPEIPVYKIAIINIRKTSIKQKKNENEQEFANRIKLEYDVDDNEYIELHQYLPDTLNKKLIEAYGNNLAKMCDMAYFIDKNQVFFVNYNNITNVYGKTEYYDIYCKTEGNYLLYEIEDYVWNEDEKSFLNKRDCIELDMKCVENRNILNKYSIYKSELDNYNDTTSFENYLKSKYECDDLLLELYKITYEKDKKISKN